MARCVINRCIESSGDEIRSLRKLLSSGVLSENNCSKSESYLTTPLSLGGFLNILSTLKGTSDHSVIICAVSYALRSGLPCTWKASHFSISLFRTESDFPLSVSDSSSLPGVSGRISVSVSPCRVTAIIFSMPADRRRER